MFDEADIELQAENILITDGGRLQIGQEGAPFQHKAIITLHGNLRSPELPVYGAKTLAVREGVLDLHGMSHTGLHSRRTYEILWGKKCRELYIRRKFMRCLSIC